MKTASLDGNHNVWWKYFTITHPYQARLFHGLQGPATLPNYLLTGTTYMLPKRGDFSTQELPTNNVFADIVQNSDLCFFFVKIYSHLINQDLLAVKQNGCRKGTCKCKELLVIDSVVTRQVRKRMYDISLGRVDYKKACDPVPRLLRVLGIYKINPMLANVLSTYTSEWKTSLHWGLDKILTSIGSEI